MIPYCVTARSGHTSVDKLISPRNSRKLAVFCSENDRVEGLASNSPADSGVDFDWLK